MSEQDERLEDIRERLAAATPGPWDERFDGGEYTIWSAGSIDHVPTDMALMILDGEGSPSDAVRADALLVANAPADLAFLLALVADQQRLLNIMRQDGTEAQDLARREERARVVTWLRDVKAYSVGARSAFVDAARQLEDES